MSFLHNLPKPMLLLTAGVAAGGMVLLVKDLTGGQLYKGLKTTDKTIIITGANTGIGKETAWEMARRGARVIMACKDLQACENSRKEIVLDTTNKYVYCRRCDLGSLDSVRSFAKTFQEENTVLDVLINNAACKSMKRVTTREGFERNLGVNYLGHFLLTNLLLEHLRKSEEGRIVNVTCIGHIRSEINKEDFNFENNFEGEKAYNVSKLANIIFSNHMAAKLKVSGDKIIVNTVNPGIVDTDLNREISFHSSLLSKIFLKPFLWPFIKSPRQGAQTIIYCALEPDIKGVTGRLFSNYKEIELSPNTQDEITWKWLWKVSEKWTRLT